MNREIVTEQEPTSLLPFSFIKILDKILKTEPLKLIWWCLAVCIMSATLARYTIQTSGLTYHLLVTLGSGGCAWFWLLSRGIFSGKKALKSKTVYLLVPAVIIVEAIEALMPTVNLNRATNEFYRVFSNVASMICIAAIVYVWHETLSGFSKIRSKQERRFRIVYAGAFSIPVAVAILWVFGAETETFAGEWKNGLITFCALIALISSRLAVEYRLRNSKVKATTAINTFEELSDKSLSKQLADKMLYAIKNDSLLTQPNLKVSDLADYIKEQEYKVTRCITNHLKFRNFNHMLNHYRIKLVISKFKDDQSSHLNIATIAFNSGYNSLGPFNRAFKNHTGITPRKFRQMSLSKAR